MTAGALAITAGIVGGVQALSSGAQAQQNAYAQEEYYERQKQIAEENAKLIAEQGSAREDLIRRRNREIIARQRAGYAESGIDVSVGSPLDVIEQSQVESELEVLTSRYQDELARRGLAQEADYADEQAERSRTAGQRALVSGFIGAGSELLSGFSAARGFRRGTFDPTVVIQPTRRPTGGGRGRVFGMSRRGGIGGV